MSSETTGRETELEEWLDGRPEIIKELANKLPPWHRYRIKQTGQHCHIFSYLENGTVVVTVNGHDSQFLDAANQAMPFTVFGIDQNDLKIIDE